MDSSKKTKNPQLGPQIDEFPTLPPELMLLIIQLLPNKDQKTFCLLSQSSRQLALLTLFRKLTFSANVAHHIKGINQARGDIKAAIKELVLNVKDHSDSDYGVKHPNLPSNLFDFLRSLPNLQSFKWHHGDFQGLPRLVASLQHCPLEHFAYWGPYDPEDSVTAPPRLMRLSVRCNHTYLYDFIRPSFSTLVELELYHDFVEPEFDLLPLRPIGSTLRKFVYKLDGGFHPNILDTIPDVFPHLTTLELMVRSPSQYFQWKNSYDNAIAKNRRLQYFALTAERFKFCDASPQWVFNCEQCGDQRFQATRALAMACPALKRCIWVHNHAAYCFTVRFSRNSSQGITSVQLKRDPVPGPYMATYGYFVDR